MSRIVVGVDPGAAGRAALDWALREAVARQVPVHAVRTWMPSTPWSTWGRRQPSCRSRKGHTRSGSRTTSSRHPQDLLVVGSRGRGGFTGLLLGSTSTQLAQHATCPVLVVR